MARQPGRDHQRVPGLLDFAIAAPLVGYAQVELWYTHHATPLSMAMSLVITAGVAWRHRAPMTVAVIVIGTFGLQAVLLDPAPEVLANSLALLLALYTAFARNGPAALPIAVTAGLALTAFEMDQGADAAVLGDLVAVAIVSAIGWFVWRRRRQVDRQFDAARTEVELAEARAAESVAAERRRIARELHDVVSHAVTVVVLQARGGRSMLARDPEQTRAALDAIELAGQEALAEMRRLVTLLREPSLDTAPQPAMSDLGALVAVVNSSGSDVTLTVHGDVVALGPGVELTAYRLAQEALTNAVGHAPGMPVRVDVAYGSSCVEIMVANPLPDVVRPAGGGFGLRGMRERVELYGGTLQFGEQGDTWVVLGTLPYSAHQAAPTTAPPAAPAPVP